ncbi:MAG: IS66-like element accessory protein TnpA [Polaromonas sp.]
MEEKIPELRVIESRKDGRRKFDEQSKRTLVEACLKPGVSVARMAQTYGVNANLLRKWIARYLVEREQQAWAGPSQQHHAPSADSLDEVCIDVPAQPASDALASKAHAAFVPVVAAPAPLATSPQPKAMAAAALHVRLPNGVEFDLGEAHIEELATIIQMLGRMPCSASTIA